MAKRNLEAAARAAEVPIFVQWEPMFLAPDTPPEGWDLRYFMESKYGQAAADNFLSPNHVLKVAGRKAGIEFNDNRRLLQTLDSHRLVEFCRETKPERENELMEHMLWRYNVEAQDMSKPLNLVECAVACGLSRNETAIMLASDKYRELVQTKIAENMAMLKRHRRPIPYTTIKASSGAELFSGVLPAGAKSEGLSDLILEMWELAASDHGQS